MLCKVAVFLIIWCITVQLCCMADDADQLAEKFSISCNTILPDLGKTNEYCEEVYNTFLNSFKGNDTDLMDLPPEVFGYSGYYAKYFIATVFVRLIRIRNNALFWSGTQGLQQALVDADVDIKCADNILAMKIIDYIDSNGSISSWCSNTDGEVFVNENCTSGQASTVFWAETSKRMAEKVTGNSFYLTTNAYFSNTSFFKLYELSTLLMDDSLSTALTVLNVNPKGSEKKCGTGDLVTLEGTVREKLFYRCFDVYGNPDEPSVLLISCLEHIIKAISKGNHPSRRPCFKKQKRKSTSQYILQTTISKNMNKY